MTNADYLSRIGSSQVSIPSQKNRIWVVNIGATVFSNAQPELVTELGYEAAFTFQESLPLRTGLGGQIVQAFNKDRADS